MNEWLPAIFGLLGTAVGATAAMWGVKRTTAAALEQARRQERHNDRQWVRDQRREAYTALLSCVDRSVALERKLLDVYSPDLPAVDGDLWHQVVAVVDEGSAVVSRIEITGPTPVRQAAQDLREATVAALMRLSRVRPLTGEEPLGVLSWLIERDNEHEAFRREASAALGFED